MIKSNKIGYVIISHESDYDRLVLTLEKSEFQSENIVIVWTGTLNTSRDAVHSIKNYISESNHNDVKLVIKTEPRKCLHARKIGFDALMQDFNGIEFVQFIDSGDYVKYRYPELDDDEVKRGAHSWDINDLTNSNEDLFWAPVRIVAEELDKMMRNETAYSSYLEEVNYYSYEQNEGWQYEIIKEDYDKITESSKLISVDPNGDCNLNLYANGAWMELESAAYNDKRNALNKANELGDRIYDLTFSLQCPAITAMPWRVSIVKRTFDAIIEYGMSYDVNIAEDLLFHTVARYICRDKNNKVSCKQLNSCYVYRYYYDSLIHKKHDDSDYIELNTIRGFCANLINGNIEIGLRIKDKVDMNKSNMESELEPKSEEDSAWKSNSSCACVRDEPDYEEENYGNRIPTYKGIELHPIRFKHITNFSENDTYICWNDIDSKPEACSVISYIPGARFCVITKDKVYQHMARIPKEEIEKLLPKWNVMGWSHSGEVENDYLINIQVPWDGEDIMSLKEQIRLKLKADPSKIELTSFTRLGAIL